MVIIDTSVWIEAYKQRSSKAASEVARLIETDEAAIVGIVLAEMLRGARNQQEFEDMTVELLAADYLEDDINTWTRASEILIELKRQGQVIPIQDALIAAHALRGPHSVYTTDQHFRRVAGLALHEPTS